MKLYSAYSVIDKYCGIENVAMFWYCYSRKTPVLPYSTLIKDYGPEESDIYYSEQYVNELFTEKEIEELREYLSKFYKTELKYTEVTIPYENDNFPKGGVPSGSRNGSMFLCGGSDGDFSIPVCGYYDLRYASNDDDCEIREAREAYRVAYLAEYLLADKLRKEDPDYVYGAPELDDDIPF